MGDAHPPLRGVGSTRRRLVLQQDMRWFPTVRYFAHRRLWYRSVDPDHRAASIGPGVRTTRALDRHPSRGGGEEDLVTMTSADPVWPARRDDRAVGGGQRSGPLALCRQGGEWPTGRWNRVAEDEPKGETRRRSEPLRLVVLDPPAKGLLVRCIASSFVGDPSRGLRGARLRAPQAARSGRWRLNTRRKRAT